MRDNTPGRDGSAASFGPQQGIIFLSDEDGLPESGSDAEFFSDAGVPHDLECGVIPVAYTGKERSYARSAGTAAAKTPAGGIGCGRILSVSGVPHVGAAVSYPFDNPIHGPCTAAHAAQRLASDRLHVQAKATAGGGHVSAYTEESPCRHVLVVSFPMRDALTRFRNPGAFGAFFASLFRGKGRKG